MSESQEVLAVLEAARDHVARAWAQGFSAPHGYACASTAIWDAAKDYGYGVAHAAHVAFLRGAGIPLPDDETDGDAIHRAVFGFNDAQESVYPVLAAFVKAIAALRAELERPKQLPTGSHSCLGWAGSTGEHWRRRERSGRCSEPAISRSATTHESQL